MFNWLWLLEAAKTTGAFDSVDSYGSIISYIIVGVLSIVGSILAIIKKKVKPGSWQERVITALTKQNKEQIELTKKILQHEEQMLNKNEEEQKPIKVKKIKD